MKLGSFGSVMSLLYDDLITIYRHRGTINPDNTSGIERNPIPVATNIKCRVSFSQPDQSDPNSVTQNPMRISTKVFCSNTVDIRKGDWLIVTRKNDAGATIIVIEGLASQPVQYPTHQEVVLSDNGVG